MAITPSAIPLRTTRSCSTSRPSRPSRSWTSGTTASKVLRQPSHRAREPGSRSAGSVDPGRARPGSAPDRGRRPGIAGCPEPARSPRSRRRSRRRSPRPSRPSPDRPLDLPTCRKLHSGPPTRVQQYRGIERPGQAGRRPRVGLQARGRRYPLERPSRGSACRLSHGLRHFAAIVASIRERGSPSGDSLDHFPGA